MKKLYIITVIFMTTTLLYALQDSSSEDFDEAGWEKAISSLDKTLFYAGHEKEGKYFNPWMPMPEKGFSQMLKWRFADRPGYAEYEENFLPDVKPLTAGYINSNDNFITWLGHASMLIKISGTVIMVDPVFGDITFVKKRRVPSALSYDEASRISGEIIILLTHNHYDHFDKTSISCLPQGTKFIVPKGLASDITDIRDAEVKEMDWWEEHNTGAANIVFLPSQHWSKRGLFDTNKSLWGSFLIDTGKKRLFVCGDTGYSPVYKEIALKYPGIDYAFMSTGASQPRWFMHYAHQNESEAIRGFRELGAAKMFPIHWGSFSLGDEPAGYPAIHTKNKFPDAVILGGGEIIKM
ncbi:MAG TPA: MBL fold metallo-hydrolase [Spirochaetota bacterium]|nr:MBL fold metallo-hydrolase [Spirochaetota bacterium]